MTYEYNLRKLFLPPIESLPSDQQLARLKKRDLEPSHLHRLGTGLFGGTAFTTRQRVIDAEYFSPHCRSGVQHQSVIDPVPGGREGAINGLCRIVKSRSEPVVSGAEQEYKKWLVDRKSLRSDLDSLGASEKWLLSKDRTKLECSLLNKLRESKKQGTEVKLEQEESESSDDDSENFSQRTLSPKKALMKHKRQMIKEMSALEQYIANNRLRLVTLFATIDKSRTRFLSVSDVLSIMTKVKAPMSQSGIEILLQVFQIRDDGLLDYQQIVNGSILPRVLEHFKRLEAELVPDEVPEPDSGDNSEDEWTMKAADVERKHGAPSTLCGETGGLADCYKQEEVKQFSQLINYCKENGIVLNWPVAEKALLIPPDRPQKECLQQLRQAGLFLHSQDFASSPQEKAQRKQKDTYEGFGKAYKELRGKRKAVYTKLSTGGARVQSKTDCWLGFEEYLRLTKHIRARPGFKYKDHGLPDNNAFWPGALLDKLRLWMPRETLLDKPYSLYNVFQPVQHPKIYNPHAPLMDHKTSWPENHSGYVQFGSQTRKQYHV